MVPVDSKKKENFYVKAPFYSRLGQNVDTFSVCGVFEFLGLQLRMERFGIEFRVVYGMCRNIRDWVP
jgi:hypothetical protein